MCNDQFKNFVEKIWHENPPCLQTQLQVTKVMTTENLQSVIGVNHERNVATTSPYKQYQRLTPTFTCERFESLRPLFPLPDRITLLCKRLRAFKLIFAVIEDINRLKLAFGDHIHRFLKRHPLSFAHHFLDRRIDQRGA